ncbi:MAG: hypothetical protein V1756_01200 [Patescibacteria group bacterium]
MKIYHADASVTTEEKAVWVGKGVQICRVDMAQERILLSAPAKLVRSSQPKGLALVPIDEKCDKSNVVGIVCDRR